MKKNIKYVCVLITLTLFMFVSCSGNLTDTLLKVMDSTNTNVFEQAGIVKPDTSAADNALKAMNSSKVDIEITDNKATYAGLDISFTDEKLANAAKQGVLAPQTDEQKENYAKAINSTNAASQKALEEKLTKPVSDKDKLLVQGTMAVASGAISSAAKNFDEDSDVYKYLDGLASQLKETATADNPAITEADKVQAQLLTNIAVSAANASNVLNNSEITLEKKLDTIEVKKLVNDTLTLYTTAKIASGSVDILQTEGLFDLFTNQKASSKEVKTEEDFSVKINADQKYIDLVINLIRNGLGTDSSKYNSKYNSYKCMVDARNLTFAIVSPKDDKQEENPTYDSNIKESATTGSVVELINAALFTNLLDPSFKLPVSDSEKVSFRDILMDIIDSSPDLFTKGEINSKTYSDSLTKLFNNDPTVKDTEFNKLGRKILTKLIPTAETADNMMKVGGFDIGQLLKSLNISGDAGGDFTITKWLDKLIEQMGGTIEEKDK